MTQLLCCRKCGHPPYYIDEYYSSTHCDWHWTYRCQCHHEKWHGEYNWYFSDAKKAWNAWVQKLSPEDSEYYDSLPKDREVAWVKPSGYFLPCKYCNTTVTNLYLQFTDWKRKLRVYEVRCGCSAPWILFEHFDDKYTAIEFDWNEIHGH